MTLASRAQHALLCLAVALAAPSFAAPVHAQPESLDGAPVRSLHEEWASQFWDLTARFESGYQLFVRFAVSNAGLGDQNGAASWQIVTPAGRVLEFHNGRRKKRWSLSPDGLRLEMGSSLLDQHGPLQRLRLDKHSAKLDLVFSERAPPVEIDALGDRYGAQLLALASPVSGTLWLEGMESDLELRGQLAITYRWMRERESQLQKRRLEFFSLDPQHAIYLLHVETPAGGHRRYQVIQDSDGALQHARPADLCVCAGSQVRDDYPLPQALELRGASLNGRIEIARLLVRYDPLMPLPRMFRWLLHTVLRPQRIWVASPYDLAIHLLGGPAKRARGTGIMALDFSNPISQNSPAPPSGSPERCECASVS